MTVTEAGMIEFARQWDPQPFHIDVEFAKAWTFGGLIASGVHTLAVTLKLWIEQGVFRACSLGAAGIGGVRFAKPVRPGDTLRVVTDVVELRPFGLATRPRHRPHPPDHRQPARRGCDGTGDDGVPEAPAVIMWTEESTPGEDGLLEMVDAGVAAGQRDFAELIEHGRGRCIDVGDRQRQPDDRPVR